jgi:hypothetical protein
MQMCIRQEISILILVNVLISYEKFINIIKIKI